MTDEQIGKFLHDADRRIMMARGYLDLEEFGAAARELLSSPIARMSVEECRTLAKETWAAHKGSLEASIYAVGDAFHRLAQPAARVEEDAGAKSWHKIAWNAANKGGFNPQRWEDLEEPAKDAWRAVAKAKEAGDA